MKVCFSFLSFGKDIFGGIENSIFNLAAGLRSHGVEVAVYTSFLSGKEKEIDGIRVHRSLELPSILPEGNTQKDIALEMHLSSNRVKIKNEFHDFLKNERADYAISFDPLWGIVQYSESWEEAPCPIVLSYHVVNASRQLERSNQIPFLFRRTVSTILKNQIEEVSSLRDLFVLPNSLDTRRFSPKNNEGFKSKIIFCNSRINPDKGVPFLLAAFAQFLEDYPDHELWLCGGESPFGDGEVGRSQVESLILELGIGSKVRILPRLKWSDIPDFVRQSSVVVLPTFYESFGRAAIEALSCGVPLIASNVGNIPSLVKEGAILVPPKSPESIYSALIELRRNEVLYQELVKRGPTIAAAFDNHKIARILLDKLSDSSK